MTPTQRLDTTLPMAILTTTEDFSLRNKGTILGMPGKLLAKTQTLSHSMLRIMRTGRHLLRMLSGSTLSLAYQDLILAMAIKWILTLLQLIEFILLGGKLSMAALLPLITEPITKLPFHHHRLVTMLGTPTFQSQVPPSGVKETFTRICWRTKLIYTKTVMSTASPRDLSSPLWAFSWVSCTP